MKAGASSARAESAPLFPLALVVLVLLVASSVVGGSSAVADRAAPSSSSSSSSSSRRLAAAFLACPPPSAVPGVVGVRPPSHTFLRGGGGRGGGGSGPPRTGTTTAAAALPRPRATVAEMEAESEALRGEIEGMRAEALRRLEVLRERLTTTEGTTTTAATAPPPESSTEPWGRTAQGPEFPDPTADQPPAPVPSTSTTKAGPHHVGGDAAAAAPAADPLDKTRWRVSLSVGREPGTWMPPDWGRSGGRIGVSFVVEFAPSPSRERDGLLRWGGGRAGGPGGGGASDPAKELRVVGGTATLGPSISEGRRTYAVRDGGWRVARGEGPAGTDLLRFYVDVNERMMHAGGDVYVPAGRVYCSCGYFPSAPPGGGGGGRGAPAPSPRSSSSSGARESLVGELRNIKERVARLRRKKDGIKNPFDLDGIKISREISRLKREAGIVNGKLNFAAVREPDRRLLRFSKNGDVGLTREGGGSCQVNKGLIVEYHILGRFSIASVDRD
jgi:hypothetical protein